VKVADRAEQRQAATVKISREGEQLYMKRERGRGSEGEGARERERKKGRVHSQE
jgi:hypothetical protein